MIQFRVQGGKELAAELAKLPARVSRRIQLDALYAGAAKVQAAASAMAPVDPTSDKHLRDYILVRPARDETKATAVAVGPMKGGAFYGSFQEWGTVNHAAQPYLRPAFDETVQLVIGTVTGYIVAALIIRGGATSRSSGGGIGENL
jgi:HK97 gp10 family phage protein